MSQDYRIERWGDLIRQADDWDRHGQTAMAIEILRQLYLIPGNPSAVGKEIANDPQCIEWICDYWNYVKMVDPDFHLECVRFDDFVEGIRTWPQQVIDELMPMGPEYASRIEIDLADRLRRLNRIYGKTANIESRNRRGRR